MKHKKHDSGSRPLLTVPSAKRRRLPDHNIAFVESERGNRRSKAALRATRPVLTGISDIGFEYGPAFAAAAKLVGRLHALQTCKMNSGNR
jgi:hypothetical protein